MKLIPERAVDLAVDAELLAGERVLVRRGSEAMHNRTLPDGSAMVDRADVKRKALLRDGVLVAMVRDPDRLIFTKDFEFDTPTAAVDMVFGANKSGRQFWRSKADGKSLLDHFGPTR